MTWYDLIAVVANLVAVALIVATTFIFHHFRKTTQVQLLFLHQRNSQLEIEVRSLKQAAERRGGGVMEPQKLKARIEKYQALGSVHHLTCGNSSLHPILIPQVNDGAVMLVCESCNYVQTNIPDFFMAEDFDKWAEERKRILG